MISTHLEQINGFEYLTIRGSHYYVLVDMKTFQVQYLYMTLNLRKVGHVMFPYPSRIGICKKCHPSAFELDNAAPHSKCVKDGLLYFVDNMVVCDTCGDVVLNLD